MSARGFLRPPRRGVPNPEPEPLGEFEGACPLMHAPPRAVPSAASMWRAETESAAANGRRIPEWYTRGRV